MNDRQRSKYNSHLVTRNLCGKETSRALTSSLPAWAALYDRFLATTLEEIDRLLEKGLDKLVLQFAGTPSSQEYILARSAVSLPGGKPETPAESPTPATPV